MKKKTLLTVCLSLVLALSMVLTACGGGSGGNGDSDSKANDFSVLHPEDPDPATSFTAEDDESGKKPADSSGSGYGSGIYSEAFAAYLKILEDHKDEILGYNWQCGSAGDPALYNKPVAVQDIVMDDTPELIFMRKVPGLPEGSGVDAASLHVFTFTGGKAVCLYSAMLDVQVGGGLYYVLLNLEEDDIDRICLYTSSGDETWKLKWHFLGLGDTDCLVDYGNFEQINAPDEGGESVYLFKEDGSSVSMEQYNKRKNEVLSKTGQVLLFNDPEWQTDEMKDLFENGNVVEMSYEEAIAFLKGGIKSGEKTPEIIDEYGFLLPDSDTKEYTKDELQSLTDEELSQAAKEILARHGRIFDDSTWPFRFGAFTWYSPEYDPVEFDSRDDILNDIEKKNLETILGLQHERNGGNTADNSGNTQENPPQAPPQSDPPANSGDNSGDNSGQGMNTRPDNGMIMNSYYMTHYNYFHPSDWWANTTVTTDGDTLYVKSNDPAGYEIITIYVVDASIPYASGDPMHHCVWHEDTSTGKRVEVWTTSYSYILYCEINEPDSCPDQYKTMKDVDQQKLLDLTTKYMNLYDVRNGSFSSDGQNYLRNLLNESVFVK